MIQNAHARHAQCSNYVHTNNEHCSYWLRVLCTPNIIHFCLYLIRMVFWFFSVRVLCTGNVNVVHIQWILYAEAQVHMWSAKDWMLVLVCCVCAHFTLCRCNCHLVEPFGRIWKQITRREFHSTYVIISGFIALSQPLMQFFSFSSYLVASVSIWFSLTFSPGSLNFDVGQRYEHRTYKYRTPSI